MPQTDDSESISPNTPHQVGVQSAVEAVPGSLWGGLLAGILYYGTQWTAHPMDAGTAAGIAGGLVALGAMLSSYIQGRRRA
jgi:tetrahydromethanopterin S-methyltransferase subunit D